MKILIVGDTHGQLIYIEHLIKQNPEVDAVIQVGDFGFYPSVFETWFDRNKLVFSKPVYAIDGNHEKHTWIHKKKDYWENWSKQYNLNFVPRGTVMNFGSSTIGFVGGAMNVDRPQEGSINKRTTNYLLHNERKEITKKFNSYDKPFDLMVTHSCPCDRGVGMIGHPMFIFSAHEYICEALGEKIGNIRDCGEAVLTNLWDSLNHKPNLWVYGHFHTHKQTVVENTDFWCVGCGHPCSGEAEDTVPYIYDTEKKEIYAKIE
jgi:predicted phosphodiesterase